MTSTSNISLGEQRLTLRQRLQAQRQVIADQLDPARIIVSGFPRSKTMRFLMQRPTLAATLAVGLVTLLVGLRPSRS